MTNEQELIEKLADAIAASIMEEPMTTQKPVAAAKAALEVMRPQLEAADRMREAVDILSLHADKGGIAHGDASHELWLRERLYKIFGAPVAAYDKARNGSTLSGATSAELFETLGMSKDEAESKERGVNAVLRRGKIIADNKEGE